MAPAPPFGQHVNVVVLVGASRPQGIAVEHEGEHDHVGVAQRGECLREQLDGVLVGVETDDPLGAQGHGSAEAANDGTVEPRWAHGHLGSGVGVGQQVDAVHGGDDGDLGGHGVDAASHLPTHGHAPLVVGEHDDVSPGRGHLASIGPGVSASGRSKAVSVREQADDS